MPFVRTAFFLCLLFLRNLIVEIVIINKKGCKRNKNMLKFICDRNVGGYEWQAKIKDFADISIP